MRMSVDTKKVARHGAYAAVKRFKEGKIDNRSREGRLLKSIRAKFLNDLGKLNAGQEVLLQLILEEILFLSIMGKFAKAQGINIIRDGRLIGALAENYISYSNTISRNIRLLYDLQPKKKESHYNSPREVHRRAIMGEL